MENIKKFIQDDEKLYHIPLADCIKDIQIKDVLFDKATLTIYLSMIISTNSASKIIKLPVKS